MELKFKNLLFFLYICLFIQLLLPYQTVEQIIEPEHIVEKLTNSFDQINTYEATFKEFFNGSLRYGRIKYKKPDKLKIDYIKNNQSYMSIIAGPEVLYVYIKYLNIVCEQDLVTETDTSKQDELITYSFGNLNRLIKLYNFNFMESKSLIPVITTNDLDRFNIATDKRLAYLLDLTPKNVELGFKGMKLWISDYGVIIRCLSQTRANKVIDILFYDFEINEMISDKEFEFEIPPNAQVIKNNLQDNEEEGLSSDSDKKKK